MSRSSELDLFLERIMRINALHMGGASAGIIGSSNADSDILNNLKKSTITFAGEYRKPNVSHEELVRLSNEVSGFLQILQLTRILSEEETNKLIDQLQIFVQGTP